MRLRSTVFVLALLLTPSVANAGNSDDVVAGSDVAITGGAVVANVSTGGAMWYNPAGVARLDSRAVDLTGAVLSYGTAKAPGMLSIESGEQSKGEFSALQAIPRALTFVASPRPSLRWGVGFFFSRSFDSFVQDSASSDASALTQSEFFATADSTKANYHLSGTVAWKHSEKFLLGGGFDIVIASQRLTEIVSGGYGEGAGGAFNRSFNQSISGGGLQLKLGLQWAPIEQVRIGWMVATPSYLVYLNNEATATQSLSPPLGPPSFDGNQVDELGGAWAGVEKGLTRLGAAYIRSWGWMEADLVIRFPLQTPELDINWKTTADVRIGGVFRVTDRLKLGAGFFTDFSPEKSLDDFADSAIDYYGFTVGIDFANREEPPSRGEEGYYIAFAVVLRYSHGSGQIVGLRFPSTFPSPPNQPGELNPVGIKINEYGINLAVKAAF